MTLIPFQYPISQAHGSKLFSRNRQGDFSCLTILREMLYLLDIKLFLIKSAHASHMLHCMPSILTVVLIMFLPILILSAVPSALLVFSMRMSTNLNSRYNPSAATACDTSLASLQHL